MKPAVSARMVKKAEKDMNPPARRLPNFLVQCSSSPSGKRIRNTDGSIKTPFVPNWGICEQDSIAGSPALALDWAKCSVTPPDLVAACAVDKMAESEMLGAHSLYQV